MPELKKITRDIYIYIYIYIYTHKCYAHLIELTTDATLNIADFIS